jgi:5-methylcytosine-specific restriction protein A
VTSRKQFIESHGATCKNWIWSWSFINHQEKFVIFGAWDINVKNHMTLIFSKDWEFNHQGRKSSGFDQSSEHIQLIEKQGYTLKTFPMKYSTANQDENGIGPAKIEDFTPKLDVKHLDRIDNNWYASIGEIGVQIAKELDINEVLIEGASKAISVNVFERNASARSKCLAHYGYKCIVCAFDFEEFYGSMGQNFIHVHHIVSLSETSREYELDPIKDLVPVCPNCHAMIHRTRPILTITQIKEHLKAKNS